VCTSHDTRQWIRWPETARSGVETGWQSSDKYDGAWPARHWNTRTAILNSTRWRKVGPKARLESPQVHPTMLTIIEHICSFCSMKQKHTKYTEMNTNKSTHSEYQLKIGIFAPTGSIWPKFHNFSIHPPLTILRVRKLGWMIFHTWCKTVAKSLFGLSQSTRLADGRTERPWQCRALHCMVKTEVHCWREWRDATDAAHSMRQLVPCIVILRTVHDWINLISDGYCVDTSCASECELTIRPTFGIFRQMLTVELYITRKVYGLLKPQTILACDITRIVFICVSLKLICASLNVKVFIFKNHFTLEHLIEKFSLID